MSKTILVLVAGIVLGGFCLEQTLAQSQLVLFTVEEAKRLRHTDREWNDSAEILQFRGLARGPRISVKAPRIEGTASGSVIQMRTPGHLWVEFEQVGAPVNMHTLAVQARRGFFSKSLTDAFEPYIQGTRLRAENVQLPSGRFVIEISIADVNGTATAETYRLQVDSR
ncbi:MAG: hypothetical protein ACREX4_08865 [Gammaproteobacteria bacterium]